MFKVKLIFIVSSCLLLLGAACKTAYAQTGIVSVAIGLSGLPIDTVGVPATSAYIDVIEHICFDGQGNLYINWWSSICKVDTAGIIRRYAGDPYVERVSGDGGPAVAAYMYDNAAMAADKHNNLYFAQNGNYCVRRIDAATGIITRIAGNGRPYHGGDNGPATSASFGALGGIAIDTTGNIYLADVFSRRIRKIDTSGIITTIAGTGVPGPESADSVPATAANIYSPYGLHLSHDGYLYFYSTAIRRLHLATGMISTFAGDGTVGYGGDGGPASAAKISFCHSITSDRFGNVFFTDRDNHTVRMVNSHRYVYRVAGTGIAGWSWVGADMRSDTTQLNDPRGIAVDTCGNVFICDRGNRVVWKVTFSSCNVLSTPDEPLLAAGELVLCPNPSTDKVTITSTVPIRSLRVMSINGQVLTTQSVGNEQKAIIETTYLSPGTYLLETICTDGSVLHNRFIKQ
jgi:hypothetical protein